MDILLIVVLVAALGAGTFTLSRYVLESKQNAMAVAAGFYFDSNYLAPASEKAAYDIYDWTNGFTVELYNHEHGNASAVDIGYSVTASGGSASSANGTLTAENGTAVLTINPTGGAGTSVTVSVTTTPYNKPLTATFHLKEAGTANFYKYEVKEGYGILTIKTGAYPVANLTVNHAGFLPDNTNDLMSAWTGGDSHTLNLAANATYSLLFFESTSSGETTGEIPFTDSITIPTRCDADHPPRR
ncbi:hypothetical protein [Zongyangia hominis]|uniref:Uncharacterized protein n=1 Tax=Zongyangia hominis TaxID=2763677 RepID=A0A926ECC7_9FIRM|nr:hypothetical protein [Zongyangia hominis]MBC8571213.1 hypothetical protein [Zongyangia hominis]